MRNEKVTVEMNNQSFMSRPTPTSLETPLRGEADILVHRRLYCGHYNACLDQSVREGWVGFTCLRCPLRDYANQGPGSEPFAHQRRNPLGG